MKLEIDIDEDYYKIICKRVEKNKPYHSPYEYEVIADGKPIEQEPTTKNNLGVDLISRADVFQILWNYDYTNPSALIVKAIRELPSVTPQEPILDKIRAEIAKYGSIWVEYKITGRRDKDIEQLVHDVVKQAKEQVLDIIDKYKAETEADNGKID